MISWLKELKNRNAILYYFGWAFIIGGGLSIVLSFADNTQVLGINAWIKPMKFFFSVAIFSWTMGWLMFYLDKQNKVRAFSIMVVIVMTFEQFVVVWQAANGRMSHFNISTPLYSILFSLMGVAITLLVLWTVYITYLFFKQKQFSISQTYLWGIRLGLIFFIIFSFEGGIMASQLSHTVGAPDGGEGLPVVNWSTKYGDLRAAHFFGMHALQLIPLAGYFVFKRLRHLVLFSTVYFLVVMGVMIIALNERALFNF